ncbi:MAG: AAA domain-containing protein [Candidatus Lokiarchaeota archaeon]|nr:AAA domain-containing protein [Candidatus Lokiarchaeota archaeon]
MDAQQAIDLFNGFFEMYEHDLLENKRKGKKHIDISFDNIVKFNPDLAESLLEEPEETIRAGELSIQEKIGTNVNFKLRTKNLPESQYYSIRNIRTSELGKLICVKGIIRQKSDVRPKVTSARFECPSCGNIITVLQMDDRFKEPTRCGCGRKGKFRLISKELVDAQKIILEESPEDLGGGVQPKRLNIFLNSDLVSPINDKKTSPGSKIIVNGILSEVPLPARRGGVLTRFDIIFDVNYYEPIQEEFLDINVNEKDIKRIKSFTKKKDVFEILVNSIAPEIYGMHEIKQALVLQMAGGVRKTKDVPVRGDIHIFLIGDPGSGKSILLKRISTVAPKARYASGKGSSGTGLTATVVKDEFMKGWALEAGALVLTNGGVACIDELDKMSKEDQSALHEGLEQQTISINKANIQATLRCQTTVLAAANPKYDRFDPYEMVASQIDLPSTLINRFDLIFPVKDLPDKTKDTEMAEFILKKHMGIENKEKTDVILDKKFLRKYFSYIRQKIKPELTKQAAEKIKEYYINMRSKSKTTETGITTIPISARQLEALIRLSEASAKLRLSKNVEEKDAQRAIGLIHFCLSQIGIDPETGEYDIDRVSIGVSSSERNKFKIIRNLINSYPDTESIDLTKLLIKAEELGISEDAFDKIIKKLSLQGDIYEPRRGFIKKI